ncbi:hypothetical protein SRHO_G00105230 [Serrasalmus rhombeus]
MAAHTAQTLQSHMQFMSPPEMAVIKAGPGDRQQRNKSSSFFAVVIFSLAERQGDCTLFSERAGVPSGPSERRRRILGKD